MDRSTKPTAAQAAGALALWAAVTAVIYFALPTLYTLGAIFIIGILAVVAWIGSLI